MESVTDSVIATWSRALIPDSGTGIEVTASLLDRALRSRVSSTPALAALAPGPFAICHLDEVEAMVADVDDGGTRAQAALELALVGLQADLRRHRRDQVVSLGVVGATEGLSAILAAMSAVKVRRDVPSRRPAERFVSARAAMVFLVDNAAALALSAQLLLRLARTAHSLSEAERVLLPGSWESS